ncbi:N-acyl-phosphatidylethanolamine-hydrolyzing phospholipase D [Acrasis kona]|uniref:N-acyl-phosphatidylethanolamine-hydrolyzing phospholipase n=1 Tax=Acrasis kona TaxID=1008807 RepID=A0AAW2ZMQ6_9EUKA
MGGFGIGSNKPTGQTQQENAEQNAKRRSWIGRQMEWMGVIAPLTDPEGRMIAKETHENLQIQAHKSEVLNEKDHQKHIHEYGIKVVKPDFNVPRKFPNSCRTTWLGHATYLIELPPQVSSNCTRGVTLLFDPIFSSRCSPSQYVGPKRFVPPPCSISDLPPIDMVFISHNHYDHLDVNSILQLQKLSEHHKRPTHYFVPLGHLNWLKETGISEKCITEMDWWDEVDIKVFVQNTIDTDIMVVCTPSQHCSGRGVSDQNTCLWSGWLVSQGIESKRLTDKDRAAELKPVDTPFSVFFAGDTGYRYFPPNMTPIQISELPCCPVFSQIPELYRPPHISLIPISTGSTLSFLKKFGIEASAPHHLTSSVHCDAADAVALHLDLKSKCSLPMHYGTFTSGPKEGLDSIRLLKEACQSAGVRVNESEMSLYKEQVKDHADDADQGKSRFEIFAMGEIGEVMM